MSEASYPGRKKGRSRSGNNEPTESAERVEPGTYEMQSVTLSLSLPKTKVSVLWS